ncbi:MAG TPA: hypothetical protein VE085_16665 [Burkholderiales bacterium]|nr:hypothetical protein [Burkholderiales bacterium]
MRICVHSNRGIRGEEIPCAFYLGGRRLPVTSVLERWQDATHHYYEITVDDGRRFVLSYEPGLRSWELAAVFAPEMKKPKAKPAAQPSPRKFFFHFRKPRAAKVP